MTREVYLDNSATTKPFSEVITSTTEMLEKYYGNPSSLHTKGIEAEKAIKKARESIADVLKVKSNEIYFTSGGTEANNIATLGIATANHRKGNHIITSKIEHPSVLNALKYLESQGFRVSYISVDSDGLIKMDELQEAIDQDTILVSIMYVNNEVGTIQPINEIAKIIRKKKSQAYFHVDAVQAFGKIKFEPAKLDVDLCTISAHKIHGPKGVGALYIKKGTLIKPIVFGGSQELNMRSGTENVPGIVGFGEAVRKTYMNFDENYLYMNNIRERLKAELFQNIEGVILNGCEEIDKVAPNILNISFEGIKAEVLLHALEAKGIYVSTGSACSSNKPAPSHVLLAMGVTQEKIGGAVRFSVSVMNTEEEIDYCVQELCAIIQQLRKYKRR